jgi:hypothetical protein
MKQMHYLFWTEMFWTSQPLHLSITEAMTNILRYCNMYVYVH